jgi:gas vesicle protein
MMLQHNLFKTKLNRLEGLKKYCTSVNNFHSILEGSKSSKVFSTSETFIGKLKSRIREAKEENKERLKELAASDQATAPLILSPMVNSLNRPGFTSTRNTHIGKQTNLVS